MQRYENQTRLNGHTDTWRRYDYNVDGGELLWEHPSMHLYEQVFGTRYAWHREAKHMLESIGAQNTKELTQPHNEIKSCK